MYIEQRSFSWVSGHMFRTTRDHVYQNRNLYRSEKVAEIQQFISKNGNSSNYSKIGKYSES